MNRLYVKYLVFSFACVYVLASCKQSIEEQAKVETSQTDTVVSSQVQSTTLIEATESWDGTPLPDYLEGQPKVTIIKVTIPPKTRLKTHKHPEINAGVLLKGNLTVVSENGDTLHMKAGDPIVELVNTWHYGENEGDEAAEIIVFYAGKVGSPITLLKDDTSSE